MCATLCVYVWACEHACVLIETMIDICLIIPFQAFVGEVDAKYNEWRRGYSMQSSQAQETQEQGKQGERGHCHEGRQCLPCALM